MKVNAGGKRYKGVLPYISRKSIAMIKDRVEPPETCDCCSSEKVRLVENSEIYSRAYGDWPYAYLCDDCGAYVGLHPGTQFPLGTMADEKLRKGRKFSKNLFQKLSQKRGWSKSLSYKKLSALMNIDVSKCHFGMFTFEQCRSVRNICLQELEK